MRTILSIAFITYKECLRHRVLYGVLIGAILLIFLSVFISGLFMRDLLKVILDIGLSSVSVGGLLVPFFLTPSMLSGDIEKKTIYTILAKQVGRGQYIVGKFLGLTLITFTIMAILTGATLLAVYGSTLLHAPHNFKTFSLTAIVVSSLVGFLGISVLNSCVTLWCCLTTSQFLATLLTLSTYVIGQSIEEVVRFLSLKTAGVEITPVIHYATRVTLYLFPNLAAFDLKHQAAFGLGIGPTEATYLTLYSLAYSAIMLFLASRFLTRRDL